MIIKTKKWFKDKFKYLINYLVNSFLGEYIYPLIAEALKFRIKNVPGKSGLKFHVPNSLNKFRVNTFLTKEPETLEWIDRIPLGSVVWDVGANIGLYSCYAAKIRECCVFAFEPSVLNLELLARNIYINNLVDKIHIIPIPVSDCLSLNTLNMSSDELGGAMSTFKEEYGHDGKTINAILRVPTIGMSMDEMIELLDLPMPDYIKMDVDGIEHKILGGGNNVLRYVKEILVEINDEFAEQSVLCRKYLIDSGFELIEKRHADMFDQIESFKAASSTFNQIWVKKKING